MTNPPINQATGTSGIDCEHMGKALALAESALGRGEFPVGCVVVQGGRVVSEGSRSGSRGRQPNELDHAEMTALRSLIDRDMADSAVGASIYCTMEPCLMCFGAILLSGIRKIVFAYEDVMGGGATLDPSGLPPLFRDSGATVVGGVRRGESLALFRRFFRQPENDYWRGSLLARYTLGQPPETAA